MENLRPLQSIPDDVLLHRLGELMSQSRRVEADIVAHIAEVEERRLYARHAVPSMFAYCTDVLHLSEAEAYLRIWAAHAARKHPMLLTMLADGRLHLTAIVRLAPHLTHENRDGLLKRATHRSKRQIEMLIAEIAPRADVPLVVRKLPERRPVPTAGLLVVPSHGAGAILELRPDVVAAPGPGAQQDEAAVTNDASLGWPSGPAHDAPEMPASYSVFASPVPRTNVAIAAHPSAPQRLVIQPLSPGRYKVQFTASAELHDKLRRLQALMSARAPDADLVAVIEQAVTEKLERLEARRFARTKAPRNGRAKTAANLTFAPSSGPSPSSRYIPAAVRRAVRERDGDRCGYVDEQGRRCSERDRLEFHHRRPFGLGGDHDPANIGLMCRAHNAYMAECDYGREAMARHRRARSRASQAAPG
jgi:hypothetical protein